MRAHQNLRRSRFEKPLKTGADPACVLTINAGSSSIKFALYSADAALHRRLHGKIDRIGLPDTQLIVNDVAGAVPGRRLAGADHRSAAKMLFDWLDEQALLESVVAVGHRVVHGMSHSKPERVTSALLAELRRITPFDPEHLLREIALIDALRTRQPMLPQVACFDTAFHRTLPRVATVLPIPRRYAAHGVRRYGFHGLSYAYVMEALGRLDPGAQGGRVILAHLGNGASLAAVRFGKSLDTSMGFTPSGGIVMSTRTGDIDPGLAYYFARTQRMSAARFQKMTTQQSGLLGISDTSSDMRDLLRREASDPRAGDAVALFCYHVKKGIGAYAAALGGLDTLVFTGGVGENAAVVRARICEGLAFLGITLDRARNAKHRPLISSDARPVRVRVIPTDEELMIARSVLGTLHLGSKRGRPS